MAFTKGQSGNPAGKPKGAQHKVTRQLRETITAFLESNFESVVQDFHELPPKERAKLYCDLLQYAVPKLQAVSQDVKFESLNDEQLDAIIHKLTQTANEDF
jgi:hypothetical protein